MGYVNDCLPKPKPSNYLGYCGALYQIPSQAASLLRKDRDSLRFLGTGADLASFPGLGTRLEQTLRPQNRDLQGQESYSGRPVGPVYRPSN